MREMRRSSIGRFFALFATALLTLAAGAAAQVPRPSPLDSDGPAAALPEAEHLREVAAALERAVRERDAAGVRRAVDEEAFFRNAISGVELPLMARASLRKDFGAYYTHLLTAQLPQELAGGGSYECLGVVWRAGDDGRMRRRLLFRLAGDGGVNYHEHLLGEGPRPTVVDTYTLLADDTFAHGVRGVFEENARFIREGGALSPRSALLDAMGERMAVGDVEGAVAAFDNAPDAIKSDKGVLALRYRAAAALAGVTNDSGPMLAAMEDLRRVMGRDTPAAAFASVDLWIAQARFDEADAAVATLAAWTGGDPFLDYYRCRIALGRGEFDRAARLSDALAEKLPALSQGAEMRAAVALERKDYDGLLRTLRALRDKYHWELGDLRESPAMSGFVASPQFRQWQADRPQDFVP